jgi:hypothetical protein
MRRNLAGNDVSRRIRARFAACGSRNAFLRAVIS